MPKEDDHKIENATIEDNQKTENEIIDAVKVVEASTPKTPVAAPLEEKESQTEFYNLLQGKGTNALARVSGKSFKIDPMAPDIARAEVDGVTIILNNANTKMDANTLRVFDALVTVLTQQLPHGKDVTLDSIDKARHVRLKIGDYMEMCGKKDAKETKKQVIAAVSTLYNLSLEWYEGFTEKQEDTNKSTYIFKHWNTRILDARVYETKIQLDSIGAKSIEDISLEKLKKAENKLIRNGVVEVKFAFDMAKYFTQAPVMPHSQKLFPVNLKKHPYAYHIGRELELHHNMNLGKANENRISVETLLKSAPGIPKYDDVMKDRKQVKRAIIDRLDKTLLALQNEYHVLEDWHYCNSRGVELTEKQVADHSYAEWSTWLVEYKLEDYPKQEEKRKRKAQNQKKQKEKKEKEKKEKTETDKKRDN